MMHHLCEQWKGELMYVNMYGFFDLLIINKSTMTKSTAKFNNHGGEQDWLTKCTYNKVWELRLTPFDLQGGGVKSALEFMDDVSEGKAVCRQHPISHASL